ncbi:MAG: NUDIX domain-containing protein [Ignavibacteria bacterium]|nr:NUDIX domain-containing protein [Ignavibacteria bacterium]
MKRKLVKKRTSSGIIIYFDESKEREFLLLKHREGHWAFPKGHTRKQESRLETAFRELREETGIINPVLLSDEVLLEESYYIEKYNENKTVFYFIGKADSKEITTDKKEIKDYKWCNLNEALNRITYNQTKKLLIKTNKLINEKKST